MNFDKVPELPDEPIKPPRHRVVWLVVVALLVAGGYAYWQLKVQPGAPKVETADQMKRSELIAGLENRVQSLAAQLAGLTEHAPLAARRELIEEALARQNELMRLRPQARTEDGIRLSEWQVKLDDTQARERTQQSRELEKSADELLRHGQTAAALEKLKEALRLQREVNGSLAEQQAKNYGRQLHLQQQVEEIEAEPLQAESRRLLAEARATAQAGGWTDALALYARAAKIQRQLNRDFPRSKFSDLMAEGRLEAEMASLSANEAHGQMESFLQQATAAAAAGQEDEADRYFTLAAGRQKIINEQFAQSRFVSMEQLEQIETERQTLRAGPVLAAVRELDRVATGHRRQRELFQSQQLIAQALARLEETLARLPKARGVDEALRQRLSYLGLRQADLVLIQDQTYDLLLPLPGREQFALLRTRVPQALFTQVMNSNPSRNPGRTLPVDSVSHAEAVEFCRRLGWVLGAPVRLPTTPEARAALAGTKEFAALTDGQEEWLSTEVSDATQAVRLGAGGAVRTAPRTERARNTGFRVVVEVDLVAPAAK